MRADEVGYTLDNTWEKAQRRLALLEELWDPATTLRLASLGVGDGWRCLEVGAGGGSITRWLCDRVGPTGQVTAVDIEPRFLEADPRPNLEIHRRDIVAEGIPGEGYDLIHTRALLMHLPTRDELVSELVGCLRPGGLILLEEADRYPLTTADSAGYVEVWDACCDLAAKAGADWAWARHVPALLAAAGVTGVANVVDAHFCPGGGVWARMVAMTWEQLAPMLEAEGVSSDLILSATAELSDPSRWFPTAALVAAWGRRP